MTDPKDGFDLLEYPCDFQFKAMVKVAGLTPEQTAEQAMKALVVPLLSPENLIKVSSAQSRTGKFESVSLKAKLQDREQLEAVYAALAADPNVVMTL